MQIRPLALAALFVLCLASGCDDGPVGTVDFENGVRAAVTSGGLTVTNEKDEPIHAVAYGEDTLTRTNAGPPTIDDPGRFIGVGETVRFDFSASGPVRASDGYYRVYWLTVKGGGENPHVGARGTLELQR